MLYGFRGASGPGAFTPGLVLPAAGLLELIEPSVNRTTFSVPRPIPENLADRLPPDDQGFVVTKLGRHRKVIQLGMIDHEAVGGSTRIATFTGLCSEGFPNTLGQHFAGLKGLRYLTECRLFVGFR